MGFGWGSTVMLMNYRGQMKSILDLQHDILVHMQKLMSSNEKTSEKVKAYAELTNISFNAVISETEKVTKGLKILVDAVTEEMNNGKEKTE
jgi:sulfopyruvate decarboxylase TPP-binding subunit